MLNNLRHITRKIYNLLGNSMFRNYLKIALRNLKKDKAVTFINVAGLAIGVACFIMLSLFIIEELQHDTFNKNYKNIYRVYTRIHIGGGEMVTPKTPPALGETFNRDFPEVVSHATVGYYRAYIFRNKEREFREWNVYWADSSFFDVFPLEFVEGDPKTALAEPYSMVITEKAALRYFGSEKALGKVLIGDSANYTITGVIKGFPKNSHFNSEFLGSLATYDEVSKQRWLDLRFMTYLVLKNGTDPDDLQKKIDASTIKYIEPSIKAHFGVSTEELGKSGSSMRFLLQPLSSIYLYSQRKYGIDRNSEWGNSNLSDISYVYIFSAVAVFILLLAVVNFMNLSTARSEKRSKEVGIRKTLGSNKKRLIYQFIIESTVITFIGVAFALCLLEFALPVFNNFTGRNLSLNYFGSFYTLPSLIGFALLLGIIAGSYPAFYLSSFAPAQALKPAAAKKGRKSVLRSSLVIFQFSVSITLLIGTLVIKDQIHFMQNKDLGFKKENLITLYNMDLLKGNVQLFKSEILKDPDVIAAAASFETFTGGIPGKAYFFDHHSRSDAMALQYIGADHDFINTYQIKMADGRFFSEDFSTDTSAVVINEAMAKDYGLADPAGKDLTGMDNQRQTTTYKIIGVIKDFNYETLHQKVRPLVIHYDKEFENDHSARILTLRVRPEKIKEIIERANILWKKFVPDENLYYDFVVDKLDRLYENERKIGIVASAFSLLAIFIACLGLFGLAAFVAEQRTKEIGIRKILGANVFEIIAILSKEFVIWTLIANLIAWPAAYYLMQTWLEDFAYRTDINLWLFLFSGITALLIAMLTLSMHTVKAALANPVESLRYE
jgi:putative ABC transport system permease protein